MLWLLRILLLPLSLCMFSTNGPSQPQPPVIQAHDANTLLAITETQEEAERIAGLYGIQLTRYSDGLATYQTDKDLQDLIELGEQNGWPQLSLNRHWELY